MTEHEKLSAAYGISVDDVRKIIAKLSIEHAQSEDYVVGVLMKDTFSVDQPPPSSPKKAKDTSSSTSVPNIVVGTCAIWTECGGEPVIQAKTKIPRYVIKLKENKKTKTIPVMQCPRCGTLQCFECLMSYSSSTRNVVTCTSPGCGVLFDEYVLTDYFTQSTILKFRPVIKDAILDLELSKLPESEAKIARSGYTGINRNHRLDITGRYKIYDPYRKKPSKSSQAPPTIMCRVNGCVGYIDAKWKCGICEVMKCKKCYEIKTKEPKHVCDPDIVASIVLQKSDSSLCPGCGLCIQKSEGCIHMFCPDCKTSFNYVQGKTGIRIPDSQNTNPEYYAYRRRIQEENARRNGEDVANLPPLPIGECPRDGALPPQSHILRILAYARLPIDAGKLIMRIYILMTAEEYWIHERLFQDAGRDEEKDLEKYRQMIILARAKGIIHTPREKTYEYRLFEPYIKNALYDPGRSMYNEKACLDMLRQKAFELYRIRQRASHHINIVNTFRAGIIDIMSNILSHANNVIDLDTRYIHAQDPPTRISLECDILEIRNAIQEQINAIHPLIEYTNDTFKHINTLLSYGTYPYISPHYNFRINDLVSLRDELHYIDNGCYELNLFRTITPIQNHLGIELIPHREFENIPKEITAEGKKEKQLSKLANGYLKSACYHFRSMPDKNIFKSLRSPKCKCVKLEIHQAHGALEHSLIEDICEMYKHNTSLKTLSLQIYRDNVDVLCASSLLAGIEMNKSIERIIIYYGSAMFQASLDGFERMCRKLSASHAKTIEIHQFPMNDQLTRWGAWEAVRSRMIDHIAEISKSPQLTLLKLFTKHNRRYDMFYGDEFKIGVARMCCRPGLSIIINYDNFSLNVEGKLCRR